MLFRRPRSVQQKITAIIFVVSTFLLILTTAQFVFFELKRMKDLAREDLTSLAMLVVANAQFPLAIKDLAASEDVLKSLSARKDVVSSSLLLPNGQTLAGYSRSQAGHVRINATEDMKFFKLEAQQISDGLGLGEDVFWQDGDHLAYFMPIDFEGSHVGYFYLSMELLGMRTQQLYLVLGWLLVMGPSVLVTYLLSSRLQRHISQPVEQLALRMEQISREKRLVGFVPKESDDEFKLLFHGFDEMMRALKERDLMLERHRKNLEVEVQVRTRALEAEKEKAEHATVAKSRFLANMSHEIRTPMIGVLGMADLLRQKVLAEEDRHLVETIYRSGEALLAILNDVLDFSKIEAGRLALNEVPIDLYRLVKDVTQLMAVNAHNKGVEIVLEANPGMPIVTGDPGRVRQILLNLVGNAVKFTDKGRVTVSLEVTKRPAGELCDCTLKVKDTGVGIKAEDQLRVFDSFDQGDSSMARKFQGTGLGLSITRELVKLMNGEILVDSTPGVGSTFTVHLPLAQSSQPYLVHGQPAQEGKLSPVRHEEAASTAAFSGRRILLAEDNPTTQKLLAILLRQFGLELEIVDNGQAAIDFLAANQVDLIFMDCQMPCVDGFEATARLRAQGLATPIVALTAYALAEDEQHCLTVGMNDFLSKPFRQAELRDVLVRWLDADVLPQTQAADTAS